MATVGRQGYRLTAERRFFTGMAFAILIGVVIGFAPTYYLRGIMPMSHPVEPLIPLVHIHGLVFSAWVLLFAAQTSLVAAGRVDLHRRLGLLGVGIFVIMVPLGILVGLGGIHRPLTAAPGIDPLSWAALPLLDMPIFAILVGTALVYRRVAATHKRLMLIAMVGMLQPALGRALPYFGVPGPLGSLLPILFLIPLFLWDWRSRGKVYPATFWGSLAITARILITPMIWTTQWWMDFARWAGSLVA